MRKPYEKTLSASAYTSVLLLLFLLLVFFASGSEAAIEYKVKKGDTFYSIAKKYHVSVSDLKNANTASAKGIKPGDKIIVPSQKNEAYKKTKSAEPEKEQRFIQKNNQRKQHALIK